MTCIGRRPDLSIPSAIKAEPQCFSVPTTYFIGTLHRMQAPTIHGISLIILLWSQLPPLAFGKKIRRGHLSDAFKDENADPREYSPHKFADR